MAKQNPRLPCDVDKLWKWRGCARHQRGPGNDYRRITGEARATA
jgi:hypothetical protein